MVGARPSGRLPNFGSSSDVVFTLIFSLWASRFRNLFAGQDTRLKWLKVILGRLQSSVRRRRQLALENLALRQQSATVNYRCPGPHLTASDRLFWVVLNRLWPSWTDVLQIVQPATVIRWHRHGFRYYWRWRNRRRGRPRIDRETRELIRRMCLANPLWGTPFLI